jgi:hypothetical protein
MSRSSLRIPAFLRTSVSLALAATMVVGAGAAESPKAGAAGALSVTTEPDNADVYVDGRLAGQTPTNVASLAAGEHRVRIVKSGYLENARVVTLTAGEPSHLNVKLTKTTGVSNETAAGQVTSTGGGGGGGSKKWLWVGLAGAGAAVAVVALMPHNKAPVPGTITVSPTGTGMAGQTSFTFTSTGASDPDGDSLTKTWTTSDGGSGTGDTFTRTFATAGSFQVNLKVSDGKLDGTAPAASVTVGPSVTGTWACGTEGGFGANISFALTQSGTSLTGSVTAAGTVTGTVPGLTGTVASPLTHPAAVSWVSAPIIIGTNPGTFTFGFSGTTVAAGTSANGTLTTTSTALSPPRVDVGRTCTKQ